MNFGDEGRKAVCELENILERGVTLSSGPMLDAADIHLDLPAVAGVPANSRASGLLAGASAAPVLPEGMTLEKWEDEIIREPLRRASGNKSQAARALGLSRNALRYRLSKIGVPDPPDKDSE
ncbi:MAG TPA: helix-turn-helix domain-containing protein [Candidatus Acidoferrales bacterium]|nr:helix-turn-helix domain-containing protein [Candidatus Acidoferrales bacterium]